MTTSCASKFCNNAMPKSLGEIRHGSFGEYFVRYMVDSPLVWMCATNAVSTAAGNPMHLLTPEKGNPTLANKVVRVRWTPARK